MYINNPTDTALLYFVYQTYIALIVTLHPFLFVSCLCWYCDVMKEKFLTKALKTSKIHDLLVFIPFWSSLKICRIKTIRVKCLEYRLYFARNRQASLFYPFLSLVQNTVDILRHCTYIVYIKSKRQTESGSNSSHDPKGQVR